MTTWYNMLSLPNIQPYHLLLTHVLILLTLAQFIPLLQILVEVFQIVPISTTTGLVHRCLVKWLLPMVFLLPWISIIIRGTTILRSLHPAVEWETLSSLQVHLSLKDLPGPALMYRDQDPLYIPSFLVTGMP